MTARRDEPTMDDKLSIEQQENIERNKREGLLCACNEEMIPYYNEQGEEHGTKVVNGIEHGYEDCHPVEE